MWLSRLPLVPTVAPLMLGGACVSQTPNAPPRLVFTEDGGCGDLLVFTTNPDRSLFLLVRADVDSLELERGATKGFTIQGAREALRVWIDEYDGRSPAPRCCTGDVLTEDSVVWTALRGRVSIALHDREDVPIGRYQTTVVLEDVIFENDTGGRLELRQAITITAVVGWLAR